MAILQEIVKNQTTFPILIFSDNKNELEKAYKLFPGSKIYNSSEDYNLESFEKAEILLINDKYISKLILMLNYHSNYP
jgi:hypothetical protein